MQRLQQETRIEPIVYARVRPMVKRKTRSSSKVAPKKKKKRSGADMKNEWLIPKASHHLRYVGIRGVYWYWLSRDVRKSEWEKWKVCLTCLEPIEDWTKADCGHIVPSSFCGEYLRLNRINLTIQHKACNNPRFSPYAGVYNAVNIDKRYYEGYMEFLLSQRKKECKEPTTNEYKELIRALPSYQEALGLRKHVV